MGFFDRIKKALTKTRQAFAGVAGLFGLRGRVDKQFLAQLEEKLYLADVGHGIRVLVIGVTPERRFNLEGNYGFVAFKNGVPLSYGGASPLFAQANTGVNVSEMFDSVFESVLKRVA